MKETPSLKEQIYNQLFDDIIRGYYTSKDIINEKTLIERFNVSKTPIREALVSLCSQNILESLPRYGYRIVHINKREIDDVLKFRCALETEMLRQNYTMITQECITKLARVNSQKHIYNNKYDSTTRWEDNTDFHLTLMSFYNNSYANDVMAQSMRLLHRAYAQYFWDTSRDSSPSISTWRHELVIESLKSKDLDGACKALAEDILGFDNLSLYIV